MCDVISPQFGRKGYRANRELCNMMSQSSYFFVSFHFEHKNLLKKLRTIKRCSFFFVKFTRKHHKSNEPNVLCMKQYHEIDADVVSIEIDPVEVFGVKLFKMHI